MALYTPEYKPNGNEIAVLTTSKGTIRVQLAGNDAPIHVGNFVELSQKGYYDGLKFHRYVPGFVIQGGCPNTRDLTPEQVINEGSRRGCGTGNPGYSIHEEYTTNPNNVHKDGTLAMARSQNPNSAGSQFYFCLGAQPFLDDGYTVFGQTIEGKDVIGQLRVGDVIEKIEDRERQRISRYPGILPGSKEPDELRAFQQSTISLRRQGFPGRAHGVHAVPAG